jgi:RNA polymerase sigma-70 factor, ECF subfamily
MRSHGVTAGSLEEYRAELTGYCGRMLGSRFDAEDAVQDTMVRAWRGLDRFEGRAALRSWLYRIATNVCRTMMVGPHRRALPTDPADLAAAPSAGLMPGADSEAARRESVRLAFVAILRHLPPRQRAALVLRDVLGWSAQEAADLLDTSAAGVNSALQRARATLSTMDLSDAAATGVDRARLDRYVGAFAAYDMVSLTAALRDDACRPAGVRPRSTAPTG